jgi:hypothetical protein
VGEGGILFPARTSLLVAHALPPSNRPFRASTRALSGAYRAPNLITLQLRLCLFYLLLLLYKGELGRGWWGVYPPRP